MIYFFVLGIVSWIALEIWILYQSKGKIDRSQDKNSRLVVISSVILTIMLELYFVSIPYFHIHIPRSILLFVGSIIIFWGVFFRLWAVLTLGKYFRITVMVQKEQKVIQEGPYTYIRHPSYTGVFIALLGVGIALGSWVGLVVSFIILFIAISIRVRVEEKMLSSSLGKEYKTYMKHTKKFIPYIY